MKSVLNITILRTLVLTLGIILLGSACTALQSEIEEGGNNLTSQEQALGSGEGSEPLGGDDGGLIYPNCPKGPLPYKLELSHTFDFSPNRETEKMQVKGHTTQDAWCVLTVEGTKVHADDCVVGFDYHGFVQGSDGKCDISGSSTALISIEGECMPAAEGQEGPLAEIYLAITEIGDPDADLSGALNCPGHSSAFIGFYPPSFSVMSFPISDSPYSDSDPGPDRTGQFEYTKTYTLIPAGSP